MDRWRCCTYYWLAEENLVCVLRVLTKYIESFRTDHTCFHLALCCCIKSTCVYFQPLTMYVYSIVRIRWICCVFVSFIHLAAWTHLHIVSRSVTIGWRTTEAIWLSIDECVFNAYQHIHERKRARVCACVIDATHVTYIHSRYSPRCCAMRVLSFLWSDCRL